MSGWQQLTSAALLGTEKQTLVLPAVDGEIGLLISDLPDDTPAEQLLLRSAGILSLGGLAGWEPAMVQTTPLPAIAAQEGRVVSEAAFTSLLRQLLEDGPPRLLWFALAQLAQRQLLPPHQLLPMLLQYASRTPPMRSAVSNVLGARGRWLAQINPKWRDIDELLPTQPDEEMWQHGTLTQRQQYLSQLRDSDPGGARERLTQEMSSLDARERTQLLSVLEQHLSPDDETLLENALADRSKEVRQTAARLLLALPQSAYAGRMETRLQPLLSSLQETGGWLNKLKKYLPGEKPLPFIIDAPQAFLAEWKQDALEESKPKNEPLGQRAWWLYQLAAGVPLAWWQAQLRATPAELLRWAAQTDWQAALLRAWYNATLREGQAEWAQAFLTLIPVGQVRHTLDDLMIDAFVLLETLPLAQRESVVTMLISTTNMAGGELLQRYTQLLPLETPAFSSHVSRQWVANLHHWVKQDAARYDYNLRHSIIDVACLLAPDITDEAIQQWPHNAEQEPYCKEAFYAFRAALARRKNLHSLFAGENTL